MTAPRSTSFRNGATRAAALLGLALLGAGVSACVAPSFRGRAPAPEPPPARSDVVGAPLRHRIDVEDTFVDLARRHDTGYLEILAANPGVDPWVPEKGREILLPLGHVLPDAPRRGIVINVAEQRLYWFRGEGDIVTHPIGVGRAGFSTPRGTTRIVRKKEHPTWTPGASAHRDDPTLPAVVKAGPDNPLGDHALYLGWPSYLIHGTNEPDGVGRRVSRGCIRLYPEDIAQLFDEVPVGTPVRVLEAPVKVGWYGDDVVLEAHWTMQQAAAIEDGRLPGATSPRPGEALVRKFAQRAAAAGEPVDIDWPRVRRVLEQRRGIPVRITRQAVAAAPAALALAPAPDPDDGPGLGERVGTAVGDAVNAAVRTLGRWVEPEEAAGD